MFLDTCNNVCEHRPLFCLLESLQCVEALYLMGYSQVLWTLYACCRLDITNELSMAIDRAADQRAAFIKQRWQAGPLRSVSQGAGQGEDAETLLGVEQSGTCPCRMCCGPQPRRLRSKCLQSLHACVAAADSKHTWGSYS